jgi:hypothetical protein
LARRAINTVDYFPHCAKSGKTLAILEGRYKATGYAFWFKLLEALCTSEDHFLDCAKPETWEYLISNVPVDEQTGTDIMDLLSRLGNIDSELWSGARIVWCPALIENIKDAYKNRRRPLPGKPFLPVEMRVIERISTEKNGVSTGRSTQNKTKQRKTNQSIEDAAASTVHKDCTSHFFELYESREKVKPEWGGKQAQLLKTDLARFKDDGNYLKALMDVFFSRPPDFAAKVGMGYNVFHSQIDGLIRVKNGRLTVVREEKVVPCDVCGAPTEREFGYQVCKVHGRRETLG